MYLQFDMLLSSVLDIYIIYNLLPGKTFYF